MMNQLNNKAMGFTKNQNVYVSSSDSRQRGFNATITSIGSKYITATDKYGRKYKFDKEQHYCIDWSIYNLEESEQSYKEGVLRKEKLRVITLSAYRLDCVLSTSEIDDIYNRIIQKFGE